MQRRARSRWSFVQRRAWLLAAPVWLLSCAPDPGPLALGELQPELTAAKRLERAIAIRDVSAGSGLLNGPLLAGIAESETALAHCWSEATWACKGPSSPSCEDGPVIAGSADGPCSAEQGGLGMFQFDGGTYAQTLARDGEDILLVEGNIARAVEFVVERVIEDIPEATDRQSALDWLNDIPMEVGDPRMEAWADFIVCRYNGCCNPSSNTCQTRRAGYRDHAIELYEEFGGEAFWGQSESPCQPVPPNGRIIDETDDCYIAGGNSQFWRRVEDGHDGGQDWTMATDLAEAANYGLWQLHFSSGGVYEIEVHLDGGVHGQSRKAAYQIVHSGGTETVIIDQSAHTGWTSLGTYVFDSEGSVRLNDNTGEPGTSQVQLAFDAIRVVPLDGSPSEGHADGEVGCACQSSGNAGSAWAFLLLALALMRPSAHRRRSR